MRARRNDFPRYATSIVMPFAPLGLAGASFNAEDESGQTPARLGKAETLYTQQCFVFVSYHCYWHDWLRLDLVRRVCLCFVAVAMTVFGAAGYRNQQYPRRPQVLELLQMQSNTETLTLTGPWLRIHGLSGLARQFDAAVSH